MSKIADMMEKLCPNGVEFKELGGILNILDNLRKPVSKEKRIAGPYPYYGANGIQDWVSEYIFDGTYLLLGEDGSVINPDKTPVLNWVSGKFWVNNHAHILGQKSDDVLLRFVYYYLQTYDVSDIVRGTPPKLNQKNLRAIRIPVPPLEIQREIVKVLDTFTALEAELEAELEARRRQYSYYRDALLAFDDADINSAASKQASKQARVMALNDIATFKYGFTAKAKEKGNYRFIRITDIMENGKLSPTDVRYVDSAEDCEDYRTARGDILMARTGATFGKTVLVANDDPAVYASYLIKVDLNKEVILPAYYWHFAQSRFYWEQANRLVSGGGQQQFNANVLKTVQIAVPSIEEQERIVSILDKFDALVNDISQGLPAEITARRQQYEHYRDRLLTFQEAA